MQNKIQLKIILFFCLGCFWHQLKAQEVLSEFQKIKANLAVNLKEYNLVKAREIVHGLDVKNLTKEEWLEIRDLIHKYPQIGFDLLLTFDQQSPMEMNRIDLAIKKLDKLMLDKQFYIAAKGYQTILAMIVKGSNFKNGRNYQLYWSLVHSLARAFYGLKQYDEAFILYKKIPSSYRFFKQAQFELMWNNYLNGRLEHALGSIATMASGNFSKMQEPEVYLLQYYIYRRMCRNEELGIIRKRVNTYQVALNKFKFPLGNWIKKDVDTLIYKQILQSGDSKHPETIALRGKLESIMARDLIRLKKEFDLVQAHIDLDSGANKNLEPVKELLTIDQLLAGKNEKWALDDNEVWIDEIGHEVFIQKDLCNKKISK